VHVCTQKHGGRSFGIQEKKGEGLGNGGLEKQDGRQLGGSGSGGSGWERRRKGRDTSTVTIYCNNLGFPFTMYQRVLGFNCLRRHSIDAYAYVRMYSLVFSSAAHVTLDTQDVRNPCTYLYIEAPIFCSPQNAPEDEDSEQVAEGIDEVICRLAQAHPTQTQKRWELITRRLNRVMKKKRIPAQPIKALFAREGLCIPQCWVAEKAQAEEEKAVARARKKEEKGEGKGEGGSGLSLFGKKKATAVVAGDKKQPGKAPEEVEKDDSDEAGESDTELESDDDEGAAADEPAGAEEGGDQAFMYQPLSKYEVFSFMRRVHDRSSSRVTEEEDAVEEMERAEKMVGVLYEQLPAATLKQKSQENRMKASLWQDSLVYGETEVLPFLKVKVVD